MAIPPAPSAPAVVEKIHASGSYKYSLRVEKDEKMDPRQRFGIATTMESLGVIDISKVR